MHAPAESVLMNQRFLQLAAKKRDKEAFMVHIRKKNPVTVVHEYLHEGWPAVPCQKVSDPSRVQS